MEVLPASNRHTVCPPTLFFEATSTSHFTLSKHTTPVQSMLHKQVLQLNFNLDIYSPSCRQGACFLRKNKSPSASLCHSWFYRNWPSPSELRIPWNAVPLLRSCSPITNHPWCPSMHVLHCNFLRYTQFQAIDISYLALTKVYITTVIYSLGFPILYQILSKSLLAFW